MAIAVLWSEAGRADLLEIYVLIGLDRPLAAEQVIDRIEAACARLADHPRIGAARPAIGEGVRVLVEAPFQVLYEVLPGEDQARVDAVRIVRVVDGRRDLSDL